jgi:hypothetical protein
VKFSAVVFNSEGSRGLSFVFRSWISTAVTT